MVISSGAVTLHFPIYQCAGGSGGGNSLQPTTRKSLAEMVSPMEPDPAKVVSGWIGIRSQPRRDLVDRQKCHQLHICQYLSNSNHWFSTWSRVVCPCQHNITDL